MCLPLFEAPKNILWVLYVLLWLGNRARSRDFGGPWDGWDTLIALWIASGWLSAAFAGLHAQEWRGPIDLVRYGSMLWLIRRTRFAEGELVLIVAALIIGTLAALAFGYWRVVTAPMAKPRSLELRSVGHINHSAIYLAIVAGLALSATLAYWKQMASAWRVASLAVTTALALSVVATASRGAIGAMALLFVMIGCAWWRHSRGPVLAILCALAIVAASAVTLRLDVVKKQAQYEEQGVSVLSMRDKVWQMALVAVERYPWFGVGMDNYNQISPAAVRAWREQAGKPYRADDYHGTSHGHSLYLNTLVERGIFGLAALVAVLAAWLVMLLRTFPAGPVDPLEWTLWGGALSAWLVSVVVGTVNTTLHHEHAILSMLLLGLWLAWRRAPR